MGQATRLQCRPCATGAINARGTSSRAAPGRTAAAAAVMSTGSGSGARRRRRDGRLAAAAALGARHHEAVGRVGVPHHEDVLVLGGVVQDDGVVPLRHPVQRLGVGHVEDGRAGVERRHREDPVGVPDEELVGGVPPAGPADPGAAAEQRPARQRGCRPRPAGRRRSGPDSRARGWCGGRPPRSPRRSSRSAPEPSPSPAGRRDAASRVKDSPAGDPAVKVRPSARPVSRRRA